MKSADEQDFEKPSLRLIYQDCHRVGGIFFIIHVCQSGAIKNLDFCKPSLCLPACMLPWLPDFDVLTDITNCLLASQVRSALSCLSWLYFTNLRDLLSHYWMCVGQVWRWMEDLNTHWWRSPTHPPLRIIRSGRIFWHHWTLNSQGERAGDGARWVGWWEEGWRDRGGGAGLVGLSVDGRWLSVLSRSPEKEKKKKRQQQQARTPQTLLNYRAETQQREERKDDRETTITTKGPAWCHLLNRHPARQTCESTTCFPDRTETDRRREGKRQ